MTYEHSDNYLIHHGVKGQKHDFRRYQNEDGSLTAEGRDHYGVGEERGRGSGSSGEATSVVRKNGSADDKKVRRRELLKKAAIGGAVAALVGTAAVAAYKKSGNMRDELRSKYNELGNSRARLASQDRYKADLVRDAEAKRGRGNTNAWETIHSENANRHWKEAESFHNAARNATRLDAVKNYVQHRGNIVASSLERAPEHGKHIVNKKARGSSGSSSHNSSRVSSVNERAQRNLDEIRRLSRERELKMNRIDDQLSRMNRRAR